MRSVSSINQKLKIVFLIFLGCYFKGFGQENSPYSRYGIGDLYPAQHVSSRGMAGVTAAYLEGLGQAINSYNPASYSSISLVTFDVGIAIDSRTLRSASPVSKYSSVNLSPSYVNLGLPLSKSRKVGLVFGLRPVSKINYSVRQNSRLAGVDSMATLYEGNGGIYQVFTGIGKRWGNFSIGVNGGFSIGRKETNSRVVLLSDSVIYAMGNLATQSNYNKPFVSGGFQYQFKTGARSLIRIGASGQLEQDLNATQNIIRETFNYDVNGASNRVDSVFESNEITGSVHLPATYTAGIAFETLTAEKFSRLQVSAEYESTQWSTYRFFGQADKLTDNYMFRVGGQLSPDYVRARSYWSRVAYRAGVFFGKDYINADGNELKNFGVTLGFGLPVARRSAYSNQYTTIHTAIELGKRGSNVNNITENFFRLSFGLSLSDVWFIKRKYD